MSSSIVIPLEYLVNSQGWLYDVEVDTMAIPDNQVDVFGNEYTAAMRISTVHYLSFEGIGKKYQIYLNTAKAKDGGDVLVGASFSGFKNSCEQLIKLLGMPDDTEIN